MNLSTELVLSREQAFELASQLKKKVNEQVFGQDDLVTEALCVLLAGGHMLMTGAPGLAKTTLVRVIGHLLGLKYGRIQFTPDLLPSDILGSDVLNIDPASGVRNFRFIEGPVFVSLLLADEINRSSPRTQSALLEAMQERSVTVGGLVHALPPPFMVFATQNPFESEGTFPLPEAQLDRFMLHSLVDYPNSEAEQLIIQSHTQDQLVGEKLIELGQESRDAAFDARSVKAMIAAAKTIPIDDEILTAIKELTRSTRPADPTCPAEIKDQIWYGASPRAGIAFVSAARALALILGSPEVRWNHIRRLSRPVLRHRIRLVSRRGSDDDNIDSMIDHLVDRLEAKYRNLAHGI